MKLAELVRAALTRNMLVAQQWVQDAVRERLQWTTVPRPTELNDRELVVAAALVELMAMRAKVAPPKWTASVGPAPEDVWLFRQDLPRTTKRVRAESPEPLAKRKVFAPADYLTVR